MMLRGGGVMKSFKEPKKYPFYVLMDKETKEIFEEYLKFYKLNQTDGIAKMVKDSRRRVNRKKKLELSNIQ